MPNNNTPAFLCRFRPVGVSLAYTLEEIEGRIWCGYAASLNDPFDGLSKVAYKEVTGNLVEGLKCSVALYGAFKQRWGIACFASDWDNPTMWAHYAGNHAGVCLVYDAVRLRRLVSKFNAVLPTSAEAPKRKAHLLRVDYPQSLPPTLDNELDAMRFSISHFRERNESQNRHYGTQMEFGISAHMTLCFSVPRRPAQLI